MPAAGIALRTAPTQTGRMTHVYLFGLLALLLIATGFVGLVGGIVAIVFWALAGLCLAAMVKTYPRNRKGPNSPTPR